VAGVCTKEKVGNKSKKGNSPKGKESVVGFRSNMKGKESSKRGADRQNARDKTIIILELRRGASRNG